MSRKRILALLFMLAGGMILASGAESVVCGDDGDEDEEWECPLGPGMTPALCEPAHAHPPQRAPFEDDFGEGCVNWFYLWCWPDTEIGCWVEGYGFGIYGVCEHTLDEYTTGTCFDNYNTTVLQLQYHHSECDFFNGQCQCLWVIGGQPPQPYKVCDCAQVQI